MRKYLKQGMSFACLLVLVLFGVAGSTQAALIDSVLAADGSTSGKVGSTILVQGSGLTPNTTLGRVTIGGITLTSASNNLLAITGSLSGDDSVVTNSSGSYRFQFRLPAVSGGQQFLRVGGTQATTAFTILPQITSVSPFAARVGESVTVTGNGLKSGDNKAKVSLGDVALAAGVASSTSSHADNLNKDATVNADGTFSVVIALKSVARATTTSGVVGVTVVDKNVGGDLAATSNFRVISKVASIDKTSRLVGEALVVKGEGFPGGANVTVVTPGRTSTVAASALGVVDLSTTVAEAQYAATANTVTMQVVGEADTFSDAGGVTVNVSAGFNAASVQSGTAGTTVIIDVKGLNKRGGDTNATWDEDVNITFDGIAVTATAHASDNAADANGTRVVQFAVPSVATSGVKSITVTGKVSSKPATVSGFVYSNPGLGASIALDKSSGAVGDTLTLTGFGFVPLTNLGKVTFGNIDYVVTPTATVGTVTGTDVTSDANGIFKVTFPVPASVPQSTAGSKRVELTGAVTNIVSFSVSASLTKVWVNSPEPGAGLAADAKSAIRNSNVINFRARGLAAGETVKVEIGTYAQNVTGVDANGELLGSVQVWNLSAGDKTVKITGLSSGGSASLANPVSMKSAITAFLKPVPVVVGSIITFTGDGFPASTAIKVHVKDYTGGIAGANLQENVTIGTTDAAGGLAGSLTVANNAKTRRLIEIQGAVALIHGATTTIGGSTMEFTVEASSASPILSAVNPATGSNSAPGGTTIQVTGTVGTPAIVNLGNLFFGGTAMLKAVDSSNTRNSLAATTGSIDDQSRIITAADGTFVVTFVVPSRAGGAADVSVGGFTVPFTVSPRITKLNDSTGNITDKVKGDTIKVDGDGFGANESVRIDFGSTSGIATTSSNASGVLTAVTFTIPAQAGSSSGIAVKATGLTSTLTATSANTVLLNAKITLSFSTGAPGDQVKVSGVHFGANENLRASVAGGEVGLIGASDGTGSFNSLLMSLPALAAGAYSETTTGTATNSGLSVWGDISGRRNTVAFNIVAGVLNVSPGKAKIGDTVTITGAGFTGSSAVTVIFEGQSATTQISGASLLAGTTVKVLGQDVASSASTDGLGRLVARFVVPAGIRGGTTGIRVQSLLTGTLTSEEDSASILIQPSVTLTTLGNIEVGDTVTFTGNGFGASEALEPKLGGVVQSFASGGASAADTNGAFSTSITVGSLVAGGKTLSVLGKTLNESASSATDALKILPLLTEIQVGGSAKAKFNSNRGLTEGATPVSVSIGSTVTVIIKGMPAGASLARLTNPGIADAGAAFDGGKALTLSGVAGSNGDMSASFVVPSELNAGLLSLAFKGDSILDFAGQLASLVKITPSIAVSPSSGASGTTITVSGKAFRPSQLVSISYAGIVQRTAEVAANGEFSAQITAGTTTAGSVTISATDSGDATVTASSSAFVFSPTGTAATLTVTKSDKSSFTDAGSDGAPDVQVGTTVRVVGAGFSANASTGVLQLGTITLTPASAGVGIVSGATIIADGAGAFEVTFTMPEAPAAIYALASSSVPTARTNVQIVPKVTISAATASVKVGGIVTFSGTGFKANGATYEVFSTTRFNKWSIVDGTSTAWLRSDNLQVTRSDASKAADSQDAIAAGRGTISTTNITVAEGILQSGYIVANANGSFDASIKVLDLPTNDYFVKVGGFTSDKFTVVPNLTGIENFSVPGVTQPDADFNGVLEAISLRGGVLADVIGVGVTGFPASGALTVKLGADAATSFVTSGTDRTPVAAAVANSYGTTVAYFLVPSTIAGGVKAIEIVGPGDKKSSGLSLEILPSATLTGSATVNVADVRTISLVNMGSGEQVAIDFGNNPVFDQDIADSAGKKSGDGSHKTSSGGALTLSVKVPTKAAGARDIRLRGVTTGVHGSAKITAPIVTVVITGKITDPSAVVGAKAIGDKVTVKGNGFGAGETVTVSLGNTTLGFKNPQSTTAAADGTFSIDYIVQASDAGSGGSATKWFRAVGSASAVIAEATAATVTTTPVISSVSPSDAQPGSTIFVTGQGFPASQAVTFTFGGSAVPGGVGGLVSPSTVTTDAIGSFSASIRLDKDSIPAAATAGVKSIVATAGTGTATYGTFLLSTPGSGTAITLSATTVLPGDTITVKGVGFASNTTVGAIQISSLTSAGEQYTDVLLSSVTLGTQIGNQIITNANGVFEAKFAWPTSGIHATETVSRTKNVRVGAATAVAMTLLTKQALNVAAGAPGTALVVTLTGLKADTNYGSITFGGTSVQTTSVSTGVREGSDPFTVKSNSNGVIVATISVPTRSKLAGYPVATTVLTVFNTAGTFEIKGARITKVDPASVEPGGRIVVEGDGFAASQAILTTQVKVGGLNPTSISDLNNPAAGTLTATANGTFKLALDIPPVPYGSQAIVVDVGTDQVASGSVSVVAGVRSVLANGVPGTVSTPSGSFTPPEARKGEAIVINAVGFAGGETVTATVNGTSFSTIAKSDGSIVLSFSAPEHAFGVTDIQLRGTTSGQALNSATERQLAYKMIPSAAAPSPANGTVGTAFTVSGSGFPAGATASLRFDGDGGAVVATAVVQANGAVALSATAPATTMGAKALVISVDSTKPATNPSFTVKPKITLSPNSGASVTSFTITGTGFPGGDAVTFTIVDPATSLGSALTDGGGAFTVVKTMPVTVPFGARTIRAAGTGTGNVDATFNVGGSLTITPTSANVGGLISLRATGYAANTIVYVEVKGIRVATTFTDSTGAFSGVQFSVPAVPGGPVQLIAREGTGSSPLSLGDTITIGQSVAVSPTTVAPGNIVSVTGSGFGASESLTVKYDGQVVPAVSGGTTGADGQFTLTFSVPNRPFSASKTVEVMGATTGFAKSATVTLSGALVSIVSTRTGAATGTPGDTIVVSGVANPSTNLGNLFFATQVVTGLTATTGQIVGADQIITNVTGNYAVQFTLADKIGGTYLVTVGDRSTVFTVVGGVTVTSINGDATKTTSAARGDIVAIAGKGFNPGETIRVKVGSAGAEATVETSPLVVTTDANGSFAAVTLKLGDLPGGAINVIAQGLLSSGTAKLTLPSAVSQPAADAKLPVTMGSEVTVKGTLFTANSALTFKVGSTTAEAVSGATTDAKGDFSAVIKVPAVVNGVQAITVSDAAGLTITVAQALHMNASLSVTPATGTLGTEVTVKGYGFAADQNMTIDFGTIANFAAPKATASGTIEVKGTISAAQTAGARVVVTAKTDTAALATNDTFVYLNAIEAVSVSPTTPAKAGVAITVTAQIGSASNATFTITGVAGAKDVAMATDASPATPAPAGYKAVKGSYTVKDGDDVSKAAVTVTSTDASGKTSSATATGTVTIDTKLAITASSLEPAEVRNGLTFTVKVTTEAGAKITADVSTVDSTKTAAVNLTESATTAGSFSADVAISSDSTSASGDKVVKVTVTDAAGNTASAELKVRLQNETTYTVSLHAGVNLVSVPVKIKTLARASDLFKLLGGDEFVSVVILADAAGKFQPFTSAVEVGSPSDRAISDGTGAIVVMKKANSVKVTGGMLSETVALNKGLNVVGVTRSGAVATASAIKGLAPDAVSVVIAESGGQFKPVSAAADVSVSGGAAYLVNATTAATLTFKGGAWMNSASAAPVSSVYNADATPVFVIDGTLAREDNARAVNGIDVTVTNLRSGLTLSEASGNTAGNGRYAATFVNLGSGDADFRVGDTLELRVTDGSGTFGGVKPVRHTITSEDVRRGHLDMGSILLSVVPVQSALMPNYPNPFNPETWIPFQIAESAAVRITIYSPAGEVVRTLDLGALPAGTYTTRSKAAYWDGTNETGERVASGLYLYRIEAGSYSAMRRMVILK